MAKKSAAPKPRTAKKKAAPALPASVVADPPTAEHERLDEDARRLKNWKRWGPYLSERQWGTVREDYSPDGRSWDSFPHDHARSRAYRWGEDGLLGICDRLCRICFSVALWNGRDAILKERLFGLVNEEGNHGEDVKECYYYLDSTPTHSFMRALYKYPQAEFPYARLIAENRRRGRGEPEFELPDTGVFDGNRYFDVTVEYAKADDEDILVRVRVANRGPEDADIWVLPTLWARNTWTWGCRHEGCSIRPRLSWDKGGHVRVKADTLGDYRFHADAGPDGAPPEWLFTENETNIERLFRAPNRTPFVKDAFHRHVIGGEAKAVNPKKVGTKAAAMYRLRVPAGGEVVLRLRLTRDDIARTEPFGADFAKAFAEREREADAFHKSLIPSTTPQEEARVLRQAYAGLLWSKQFYHYVVEDWLEGDPEFPPPPRRRLMGRNSEWRHLYSRDIISMPDKWEYPWFAAWDTAFHMIPFCTADPGFAKAQLELFLREWYMHPNGQIPAYEWAFDDVNPPVHAWAVWRVYKMTGPRGARDRRFLERCFHKLLLNFTWWLNRKDPLGRNIFAGGFLGLDNIGVFDRSRPLPTGGHLEQADGTAWMAFFCGTMLSMALELALHNDAYEDIASKFFEHFLTIADAMNHLGGSGLWDEEDGFYYDQIIFDHRTLPLKVRSMVGVIPLLAVEVIEQETIDRLPGFRKRMEWFLENRRDLSETISFLRLRESGKERGRRLLAIPSKERLVRVLEHLLSEDEFLSPYGVRSLSRYHAENPYRFLDWSSDQVFEVKYAPGDSETGQFGGNSNWRGPIWFPINFLLIEALERYNHFFGDEVKVRCPGGDGGRDVTLKEAAHEIAARLTRLFLPDANGARPSHGGQERFATDPHWRDLVLFHEYFHGDTGRGLGASHQTGWTALVIELLADCCARRE